MTASGDAITYQSQRSADNAVTWVNISGTVSATFTIASVETTLNGDQYRAVTTGPVNSVTTSAATLTVAAAIIPPTITAPPADQVVVSGADAVFNVTATGTSLSYQWQASTDSGDTWVNVSGATATMLTLQAVAVADSGKTVRVVVTNSAGSVNSSAALRTVAAAPSLSISATVVAPATFTVAATGTPAPSYQWQTGSDGATYADIVGANAASYTTPATTSSDPVKFYRVQVSNSTATLFSNEATLTVTPTPVAPTISVQPVTATVSVPATASFYVVANGTPTPTYQWQLSLDNGANFANINGAVSANYATAATTASDTGKQFRVVVTNSAGSVTSTPASLTIFVGATSLGGDPVAISIDPSGNLYMSVSVLETDSPAQSLYGIQKVSPGGAVSAVAGGPTPMLLDGVGTAARFNGNGSLAVDASDAVHVADSDGGSLISPMSRVVRKVGPDGTVTTIAGGPAGRLAG